MAKMKDSCLSCCFLKKTDFPLNYTCEIMRLPDPKGEYKELPVRTIGITNKKTGGGFAWTAGSRKDTEVRRSMSTGAVEGWGKKNPQVSWKVCNEITPKEYEIGPCSSHSFK